MIVDIGEPEDFIEGTFRIVRIAGRELGIIRWRDRLYALRNACPHQGGPICAGVVGPRLDSPSGTARLIADESRPVVSCPWHGWEFELSTGQPLAPPGPALKTYPTHIRNGRVMVEVRT